MPWESTGEVRGYQMIGHQPRLLIIASHLMKNGLDKSV